jgi:hypothetical protein
VYAADKIADLKPLYGALFRDLLEPYTHWGWVDLDGFFGDTTPLINDLEHYDVVTYPHGVCHDVIIRDSVSTIVVTMMLFASGMLKQPCI